MKKKEFLFIVAIPSMMFAIYFPVCLRVVITRLVPGKDKGWRKKIFL